MPIDDLRRSISPLVETFALPRPWDLLGFLDTVGKATGRPILLLPTDTSGGICGMWVETEQADYIAYEERTSLPHQQQIILHELGHILGRHPGKPLDSSWVSGGRRTPYNDYQEQWAETFADELLLRLGRERPAPADPATARIVASLDPEDPDVQQHRVRPHRRRWALRHLWSGHTPR
ncbi:ImmA/IrrE family metallo-endopeptidase [Micromonospora sp. WMMD1102]|uniref:ImmA/IrrE family metallo-endopeptidase n=1 Tax=Micromonospora sp. WMMD1102 TaxID=3016105 RepID=UPI0024155771|nr:ImmA/IrrE family metallo-endopeptidase [Micromonospora sp. WMMD1102]MDG4787129.1 ImmA/IrrE family metallo-endopeptidase [Micromonospora sp. WMMD1102]